MPEQASNTTTEATDVPGQVITYTCNTGFEFVGSPESAGVTVPTTQPPTTTTLTPLTWHTFKGADYALGEESGDITWDEARALCQGRSADLVSIASYEASVFISTQFGTNFHAWIGGTDSASEGTFTWSDGTDFFYRYWQNNNEECYEPTENNGVIQCSECEEKIEDIKLFKVK